MKRLPLLLLATVLASCDYGSSVAPLPEITAPPIITECDTYIELGSSNLTSTTIHFTTTKDWRIYTSNTKAEVAWLQLDKTDGGPGNIEIVAKVTEANPSSIDFREAYIKIISDTASRVVTISHPPRKSDEIAVQEIHFDVSNIEILVGDSLLLIPIVSPSNATNQEVLWQSSNSAIMTVDSYGKIAGENIGEATLTVRSIDGDHTALCSITVSDSLDGGGTINDWN